MNTLNLVGTIDEGLESFIGLLTYFTVWIGVTPFHSDALEKNGSTMPRHRIVATGSKQVTNFVWSLKEYKRKNMNERQ